MPKYLIFIFLIFLAIGIGTATAFLNNQTNDAAINPAIKGTAHQFKQLPVAKNAGTEKYTPTTYRTLWASDFKSNTITAFNKNGQKVWQQHMADKPIPPASFNTNTEYVTVAPDGNLIIADGDGMMVQEIDRATHALVWQYGIKDVQGFADGLLHQPDKAFKINDHEILINDGNNRRVIIIDQNTNRIVWQYGETMQMGEKAGLLKGNTSAFPILNGQKILITDTLQKKVIIVDRATKQILWQWQKNDAKWLQHAWPTTTNTLVMEDRQANQVFEVNTQGDILWQLSEFADGTPLNYPTDVIKLGNGHVLVAEAGRGRIVEFIPENKQIVNIIDGVGFVTTIAIDGCLPSTCQ